MHRILAATDWSAAAAGAVRRAASLAAERNAELHIVHVLRRAADADTRETAREELAQFARTLAHDNPCVPRVTSSLRTGPPAHAILDEAGLVGAELIVLGGHGEMRWADEFFGTTVEQLLRQSRQPVLVVQSDRIQPYRRVLSAVAADRSAETVLNLACSVTSANTIFAVHAFHVPFEAFLRGGDVQAAVREDEETELRERIQTVLADRPHLKIDIHPVAMEGEVLPVLIRAWDDLEPDLLVVGTHGRSGLGLALHGSFTDAILEGLPFDTLVQRLDGD